MDPSADLDALFAVARDCEAVAVDAPTTSRSDIASLFASTEADLVHGTRAAVDEAGAPVGFVSVEADDAGRQVDADAYVSPRAGDDVWDLLLGHARTYAEQRVSELDVGGRPGWTLSAGCYAADDRYSSALARAGLAPVRRFHTMGIVFDPSRPPAPPAVPAGVSLELIGTTEAGLRTAHAVADESFVGHWRHVHRRYEEWIAYVRTRSFAPDQWWLASVDGVSAAVCLANDHLAEHGWGYVGTLGVLEEYRGRGLGRLLLEQFFAQSSERGRLGVRLGVDTENGTGAPALYAAVGMTPVEVIDAWELPLA
ncbi:MAG TPA: GNAT family N-acetyltransferase [Candidatus Limnocylindria bacterium]|nr:GNAT family N-acetyltransferase [Candidatus Limnocylindria bacterium]